MECNLNFEDKFTVIFALEQATKGSRGSRGTALLFS